MCVYIYIYIRILQLGYLPEVNPWPFFLVVSILCSYTRYNFVLILSSTYLIFVYFFYALRFPVNKQNLYNFHLSKCKWLMYRICHPCFHLLLISQLLACAYLALWVLSEPSKSVKILHFSSFLEVSVSTHWRRSSF